MPYGLIILEQWQKNENLIDKLLEDKIISKVEHEEILYATRPAKCMYGVESDFFPNTPDGSYAPVAIVTDGQLVSDSRPLDVHELKEAQQSFDLLNQKANLLKKEIGQLVCEKELATRRLLELQRKEKELKLRVEHIQKELNSLDKDKIEEITNCTNNIVSIANGLEVKANVQEISNFFNEIEKLDKLINS